MGVPKFYRWVSERYPCLSEVVKEFQLPEFDNLYLDMNGIVHVCSHPDDENPHFRITEEKIFKDICHYIDFLFRMIKPRRVFFMAVDGVAPRAKMNQQRGRRFRSAREAELLIQKAQEKGEVLPTEKRFDSNCITPGTPFMVRLQEHLKYFVIDKISNDPMWQGPKIYLSGHETPGEGEHKVMDFIRYSKSQADYDPDTRHCLYGLDADLIMLGLASHEPHFSLLREEVRFGGKKDRNKRPTTPEETTFHLLHLSLMRDYLAYEFTDLKGKLPFPWDLESIIDDWILMGFLVGNDFIPHLPHLHIHHDALPLLWRTYKNVLPTLDGYINEGGHLNLPRFEKYFQELSKFDEETFESAFSDLKFLESKIGGKSINESAGSSKQKVKMKKLQKFKVEKDGNPFRALEDLSGNNDPLSDDESDDASEDESDADDEEEEFEDDDEEDYNTFGDEFKLHKRDYYMSKMEYAEVTPEVLKDQAHGYVVAIQWILLYYFEGCPSWSWFYAHHYAPYISDIKGFSDMKITFELSTPFLPFQQLMAVLPAASKDLLPPALQALMIEDSSPVLDFYPVNFETDLNGKQQDWEAVVLIPFIEEQRLLDAMASKEHLLTAEEKSRNCHGPHLMYQYTPENMGFYPSSLPGVFPDIHMNRAKLTEMEKDLFHIDANKLRKGLLDTVRVNVYFPGFPTLKFLPHTHELIKAGVKVFQHNSRGENMVLRVKSKEGQRLEEVADELLGNVTHVGWPHLHEARVVAVANESFKIELVEEGGGAKKGSKKPTAVSFNRTKLDQNGSIIINRDANAIKERHMDRFAIDVGNTEIVIYASPMTGRTYTYGAQGAITLEKQFASKETPFLHQMTVKDLEVEESGHTTFKTLEEVFPESSPVFMVGNPHYGAQGKVKEILPDNIRIRIALDVKEEPDFRHIGQSGISDKYLFSNQAAQQIGIDGHTLSRITGSVFVEKSGQNGGKVNIGLNLKFTKRGEEVPGYTKKMEKGWAYSYKCVKTVEAYISKFPDVWLRVQKETNSMDNFTENVLFPEGSATKLLDVTKYLDELPCSKAPRMKFGAEILDEEQVKEIEEMTSKLNPVADIVKMKVKPRLLFRPLANQGSLVPDPGTDFYLYDRVVVVKAGYSVPFGKRGTIIGIPNDDEGGITPNSLYDVVFDEAFTGGITLRCSPNKGYRVPGSAMLNITFGEFRKNRPESQQNVSLRPGGRPQQSQASGFNTSYSGGGAGRFNSGYNNNNTSAGRQNYNDRAGSYGDRAAMWRQQQQQFGPQSTHQFQQQQVKWDKGQPLFGQVFTSQNHFGQEMGRSGGMAQPKFVTPKVQGSPTMISRSISQENKSKTVSNSEFDNMWKNLESHQSSKQGSKASDPVLKQAASALPSYQPGKVQVLGRNQNLSQPNATTSSSQPVTQLLMNPNMVPSQPKSLVTNSARQPGSGQSPQPQGDGLLPTPSIPMLQSQPPPNMTGGRPSSAKQLSSETTAPIVQTLFENASKAKSVPPAGPENAEFLAMFNSLKTQTEEAKRVGSGNQVGSSGPQSAIPQLTPTSATKSPADLALKQMLKIGVEPTGPPPSHAAPVPVSAGVPVSVPTSAVQLSPRGQATSQSDSGLLGLPGKSQGAGYGRQVSLQELFEEANRQQQKQQDAKVQQPQQLQQTAPATVARPGGANSESRDHVAELEAYCKNTLQQGPPQFDYKLDSKGGYIAIVILPNRQTYEGSLCRTKEEAAKSAASMALLCLNTKANTSHPVITSYMPGAQRPTVNRFFSPNSAFGPIGGIPGPNPGLLPRHPPVSAPMLLTPQHFINQPPPTFPLHQLYQHQQKQQQQQQQVHHHPQQQQQPNLHQPPPHLQQNLGAHGQNYGWEHQQRNQQQMGANALSPRTFQSTANQMPAFSTSSQSGGHVNSPASTTSNAVTASSTATSISQQFIPLQVSRNQKTPNKRKDSESDKVDGTLSSSHDRKSHNSGENVIHPITTSTTGEQQRGASVTDSSAIKSTESKVMSAGASEGKSKNGVVPHLSTSSSLGTPSTPTSTTTPASTTESSEGLSKSVTPTVKSGLGKKKSRLAANFGGKKS